jgi:conjugative relaxase-like TrwC/TraI family protein
MDVESVGWSDISDLLLGRLSLPSLLLISQFGNGNSIGYSGNPKWGGEEATELGLAGPVRSRDFASLLNGRSQNGEVLARLARTNGQHRAARDAIIDVPKSMALMTLVAGDEQLQPTHCLALSP